MIKFLKNPAFWLLLFTAMLALYSLRIEAMFRPRCCFGCYLLTPDSLYLVAASIFLYLNRHWSNVVAGLFAVSPMLTVSQWMQIMIDRDFRIEIETAIVTRPWLELAGNYVIENPAQFAVLILSIAIIGVAILRKPGMKPEKNLDILAELK